MQGKVRLLVTGEAWPWQVEKLLESLFAVQRVYPMGQSRRWCHLLESLCAGLLAVPSAEAETVFTGRRDRFFVWALTRAWREQE